MYVKAGTSVPAKSSPEPPPHPAPNISAPSHAFDG
jgi:hypothetical protein